MAKKIIVRMGEEEIAFDFQKLERETLYGSRKLRVVSDDGSDAISATWDGDASILLPEGATSLAWVDETWRATGARERIAIDENKQPVPSIPSTLDVPQDLNEANANDLLDAQTKSVYLLDASSLPMALSAALDAGKIFSCPFRYYAGTQSEMLFLLKNKEGLFGLVTTPHNFDFVSPDDAAMIEEEDEEMGLDDLDLSMF